MVLNSSNGWTQIIQVTVFNKIKQISQKNFEKPKIGGTILAHIHDY